MSMNRDKSCIIKGMGSRLEEVQRNLGLTQDEMAEMMGISKEQYRKYCKGHSEIPSTKLFVLFDNMRFDIKYVMTGVREDEEESFEEHLSSMTEEGRTKYIRDIVNCFGNRILKVF